MSRRKRTPFQPWETRNADGIEKRYIRMGVTQLSAEVMRKLSPAAFKIYVYMKIESSGCKQFTFPHSKYCSFMSKPTFFKVVTELENQGFIDVIQRNRNLRRSNIYAFSERWKSN
ncbi:hypothetical protein [Schaedlerella arabinosiphila]|uniref:hypothetical protein n=1 Tax=Schaedlerella arabinosiphila TaxID=2044587 RepID=UPI0025581204|nr:hypothetical protein [Schaedlerella arabinosiphila]